MSNLIYTWPKVKAGDIISFRYKGKKRTGLLTTILVLNPKFPYIRKDNTRIYHLIGLKLESAGIRPTISDKSTLIQLLESIGTTEVTDPINNIYRVKFTGVGYLGAVEALYKKMKNHVDKYNIYRTYDWLEAKNSTVFLEPIILPEEFKEMLLERQFGWIREELSAT